MFYSPEDILNPYLDWKRIGPQMRRLCQVSESTIYRWRRHPHRIPASSRILAELLSSGHLGILWPEWRGYVIHGDQIAWWSGEYAIRASQIAGYDWLRRCLERSHQEIRRLERLAQVDHIADIRNELADLVDRLDALAGPARRRN